MITATAHCGHRTVVRGRRGRRPGPETGRRPRSPGRRELLVVAEALVDQARQWPDLEELRTRSWRLLAATEAIEAWVIGWPPGGTIALHDHGDSAGAVAVAGGELVETAVVEGLDGTVTTATRRMATGSSWTMGSRHVHDIVNHGDAPAVSVHVYAPRLTSMTNYRLEDGLLVPEDTVHYRLGSVVP